MVPRRLMKNTITVWNQKPGTATTPDTYQRTVIARTFADLQKGVGYRSSGRTPQSILNVTINPKAHDATAGRTYIDHEEFAALVAASEDTSAYYTFTPGKDLIAIGTIAGDTPPASAKTYKVSDAAVKQTPDGRAVIEITAR